MLIRPSDLSSLGSFGDMPPWFEPEDLFASDKGVQERAVALLMAGPLATLCEIAQTASMPGLRVHPHHIFAFKQNRDVLLEAWKAGRVLEPGERAALAIHTRRAATNLAAVEGQDRDVMTAQLLALGVDSPVDRAEWALCQTLKTLSMVSASAEVTFLELTDSDAIQASCPNILNYWMGRAATPRDPQDNLYLEPAHLELCEWVVRNAEFVLPKRLRPPDRFIDQPALVAGAPPPPEDAAALGHRQVEVHSVRSEPVAATPDGPPEAEAPPDLQLAAALAHDYNNLSQVVMGYAQMALDCLLGVAAGVPTKPIASGMDHLKSCLTGVEQMTLLTAHVLQLAHKGKTELEPVDLKALAGILASLSKKEITNQASAFSLKLEDVPPVLASSVNIGRIIRNLIKNGVESMSPEESARNTFAVSLWAEGDNVILEVRDSGTGIPPEKWESVFQGNTTKTTGHGLGLSTSRQFAEAYGGTLVVQRSETEGPNRGTTFRLTLPVAGKSTSAT